LSLPWLPDDCSAQALPLQGVNFRHCSRLPQVWNQLQIVQKLKDELL
jgi:hypothetical protein